MLHAGAGHCYTGVGSRRTPPDVLQLMRHIASALAADGWTLRSGHAPGADQAFERGARTNAEIYLPWTGFERNVPTMARYVLDAPFTPAYELASKHHPRWDWLRASQRALHARNAHEAFGRFLDDPSLFVICWTPGAKSIGGTGQVIRMAHAHEIPVYDLADPGTLHRVKSWLHEL